MDTSERAEKELTKALSAKAIKAVKEGKLKVTATKIAVDSIQLGKAKPKDPNKMVTESQAKVKANVAKMMRQVTKQLHTFGTLAMQLLIHDSLDLLKDEETLKKLATDKGALTALLSKVPGLGNLIINYSYKSIRRKLTKFKENLPVLSSDPDLAEITAEAIIGHTLAERSAALIKFITTGVVVADIVVNIKTKDGHQFKLVLEGVVINANEDKTIVIRTVGTNGTLEFTAKKGRGAKVYFHFVE